MMRLIVFWSALSLVLATGCDADPAEPAPVPYTAVPETPSPFQPPTAPVLQP